MTLTPKLASKFARIALGHLTREYPNKLDHVMGSEADVLGPRALHPIFFGSFDWHSCVHGYWLLARILRRHPDLDQAPAIRELFAAMLTPDNIAAEVAYLARPESRGFERPYGWGWAVMLGAELRRLDHGGLGQVYAPLAGAFARRFQDFLPIAPYPVRTGVHSSTAFALGLALIYANVADDRTLADAARAAMKRWYDGDADAQAWEPSGEDFLSPTLAEAWAMSVADPEGFAPWFDRFLPRAAQAEPQSVFTPATVTDRTDGKIAHLDGLNLSRAWCWREIAGRLGERHPARTAIMDAADRHLATGLPHVAGHYMGEHWLATFAALALDGAGPEPWS